MIKEQIIRAMMKESLDRDYGVAQKLLGKMLPDTKYEDVVARIQSLGFADYIEFEEALKAQDSEAVYDLLYADEDLGESISHNARAQMRSFERLGLKRKPEQDDEHNERMKRAEAALAKLLDGDDDEEQVNEYGRQDSKVGYGRSGEYDGADYMPGHMDDEIDDAHLNRRHSITQQKLDVIMSTLDDIQDQMANQTQMEDISNLQRLAGISKVNEYGTDKRPYTPPGKSNAAQTTGDTQATPTSGNTSLTPGEEKQRDAEAAATTANDARTAKIDDINRKTTDINTKADTIINNQHSNAQR